MNRKRVSNASDDAAVAASRLETENKYRRDQTNHLDRRKRFPTKAVLLAMFLFAVGRFEYN